MNSIDTLVMINSPPKVSESSVPLGFALPTPIKWTWACRMLDSQAYYQLQPEDGYTPRVGDVALVKVVSIGHHAKIFTVPDGQLRMYTDDMLVCVFGNRYATDAYEAEVRGTGDLQLLTGAGMIGSICSKHSDIKAPTRLLFMGYLADRHGQRLNLKSMCFLPTVPKSVPQNVFFVVGTGMNSGKTTTVAKLVKSLLCRKLRVAACKLTGSVSQRDLFELRSTDAHYVRDFSDYGFPSTYLCSKEELIDLFYTMLADAASVHPDVVVVEIADGFLQRETKMLLQYPDIKQYIKGVLITATCASSALYVLDQVKMCGHRVIAISGVITNSPLYMREFSTNSDVPVVSSRENVEEISELIMEHIRNA